MHLVFPGRSLSTEGRRGREAAGWVSDPIVPVLCDGRPPELTLFLSEPSGSGRLQWAWSCWPRPGTTPRCRGCFRRLISTTQAYWAAWTVLLPRRRPRPCTAACTGLLQHPIRSCSGRWYPECSSTAWGLGVSRPSTLCPTPSQAPLIPGEEGRTVPQPSRFPPRPGQLPRLSLHQANRNRGSGVKGELTGGLVSPRTSQPSALHLPASEAGLQSSPTV